MADGFEEKGLASNCPDSLQDLCVLYCISHLQTFKFPSLDHDVHPLALLPLPIRDRILRYLLNYCLPSHLTTYDKRYPWKFAKDFLRIAKDTSFSCFHFIRKNISIDSLEPDILTVLKLSNLVNIDIFCCSNNVAMEVFEDIVNRNMKSLRHMRLRFCREVTEHHHNLHHFLCHYQRHEQEGGKVGSSGEPSVSLKSCSVEESQSGCTSFVHNEGISFSFTQPQREPNELRTLYLSFLNFHCIGSGSLYDLLQASNKLTSLTLVNCKCIELNSLKSLQHLQSLVLSDIRGIKPEELLFSVSSLTNLRHLDLSSSNILPVVYGEAAADTLQQLICFPRLTSFDVSGTNLPTYFLKGGRLCPNDCQHEFGNKQMEFLGLWNCSSNPCQHKCLPANQISGTGEVEQIAVALRSHLHNPNIMMLITNYLHDMIPTMNNRSPGYLKNACTLVEGILTYLETSLDMVVRNLAKLLFCLYSLLCHPDVQQCITTIQKRRLLQRLLFLVNSCVGEGHSVSERDGEPPQLVQYTVRMALIVLQILNPSQNAIYCHMFELYVSTMLSVLDADADDSLTYRALNHLHMACRASQEHKVLVGTKLGLIEALLELLAARSLYVGENIIEKAWSVLWSLTDEAPVNCETFIYNAGLESLLVYTEDFPESESLFRRMSGVLCNVSENSHLRHRLMRYDFIQLCCDWMHSSNIDISSHTVAILIQLAVDGPAVWHVAQVTRDTILQKIDSVIDRWNPTASRGIKYKSLSPMLKLIGQEETPEAQYWGAWTIYNLIKTKLERYCKMFSREKGEVVIQKALDNSNLPEKISVILRSVLVDIDTYKAEYENLPVEAEELNYNG